MPFKSKSQMRWMFANHPEMAKRWYEHTDSVKKLPDNKIEEGKKAAFVERNIVSSLAKIAAQTTLMGYGQNNGTAKPSQPQPKLNQTSSRNIDVNKTPNPPAPTGKSVVPRGGAEQYGSNYFEAIKAKAEQAKQQPAQQKQGFITKLAQGGYIPNYSNVTGTADTAKPPKPIKPQLNEAELAKPITPQEPADTRAARHPVLQEAFKGTTEKLPPDVLTRMRLSDPETLNKAKTMWGRQSFLPGYRDALTADPSRIVSDEDIGRQWSKAHQDFLEGMENRESNLGPTKPLDTSEWTTNYLDLVKGQGPKNQVDAARQYMQDTMAGRLQNVEKLKPLAANLRQGKADVEGQEQKINNYEYFTGIDEEYANRFKTMPWYAYPHQVIVEGGSRLYSSPLGSFLPGGGFGGTAKTFAKEVAPLLGKALPAAANRAVPSLLSGLLDPAVKATQLSGLTNRATMPLVESGSITPEQAGGIGAGADLLGMASSALGGVGPLIGTGAAVASNLNARSRAMDPTGKPLIETSPVDAGGLRWRVPTSAPDMDAFRRMGIGLFGSPEDKQELIRQQGMAAVPGLPELKGYENIEPSTATSSVDNAFALEGISGVPNPQNIPANIIRQNAIQTQGDIALPGAIGRGAAASSFLPLPGQQDTKYNPTEMWKAGLPEEEINDFMATTKEIQDAEAAYRAGPRSAVDKFQLEQIKSNAAARMAPAIKKTLDYRYDNDIKPQENFAVENADKIRAIVEKTASGGKLSFEEKLLIDKGLESANAVTDYALDRVKTQLLESGEINVANIDTFFNGDKVNSIKEVMQLLRPLPNGQYPPVVQKAKQLMIQNLVDMVPDLAESAVPIGLSVGQSAQDTLGTAVNAIGTAGGAAASYLKPFLKTPEPGAAVPKQISTATTPPPVGGPAPELKEEPVAVGDPKQPAATVADAGNPPPASPPAGATPDGAERAAPNEEEKPKGIMDTFVNGIWNKMSWWEQIMTIAGVGMAAVSAFAGITGTGGGWLSMLGILGGVAGLAPSLLRMVGLENLFGGGGSASAAEPPVEGLTLPTERDAAATNPDEVFQQVDENGQNPQPVTQAPIPFDEFQSQLVDQYSKGDKTEAIKSFWNRAKIDQDFMNQLKEIQKGLAENKVFGTPMPITDPAKDRFGLLPVRNTVIDTIVGESKKKGVPVSPEAAAILVDNWKQNVAPTIK